MTFRSARWRSRPQLTEDATGSLLAQAGALHGEAVWPKCSVCMRSVDAYGIDADTPKYIELFARCDGIASIYGGRHARTYRAGIRIDKAKFPTGLTEHRLRDILSRLLLKPGKFSKWSLVLGNPSSVVPR